MLRSTSLPTFNAIPVQMEPPSAIILKNLFVLQGPWMLSYS